MLWLLRSRSVSDLLNWPLGSWLEFLIATVCLVTVVIAIIQLIARANKETDPAEAEREMLLTLSELYRQGDLTNEEFRSIKGQILQRLSTVSPAFSVVRRPAESAAAALRTQELDSRSESPLEPRTPEAKVRSAPEDAGVDIRRESVNRGADEAKSGAGDSRAKPGPDESQ